jgi:hypothetical protein
MQKAREQFVPPSAGERAHVFNIVPAAAGACSDVNFQETQETTGR